MKRGIFLSIFLVFVALLLSSCVQLFYQPCKEHVDSDQDLVCDRCEERIEPPVHEHTYSDTYMSDVYSHWYPATCEHTWEKKDNEDHILVDIQVIREASCGSSGESVGTCSVCGHVCTIYAPPLSHPVDYSRYEYDENYHWHPISCGHKQEHKATYFHEWDEGVVTKEGTCLEQQEITKTCTECGKTKIEYGRYGKHIIDTEYTITDEGHYQKYLCGHTEYERIDSHSYKGRYFVVIPTCTEPGESRRDCRFCGYYISQEEPATGHSFSEEYEYNATHHWLPATCEHTEEVDKYYEHNFAPDLSCHCGYQKVPNDGIAYEFINNYKAYRVVGLEDDSLTEIVIPDQMFGLPITEIKEGAFENNTKITSLSIGKNVTTLPNSAFFGCTALESITVSEENEKYTYLEGSVVEKQSGVLILATKNTKIVEGVSEIASYAFYNVAIADTLVIPNTVATIQENAFEGLKCNRVEIEFSGSSLPRFAFKNATFTELVLPEGLSEIGAAAFYGCSGLVKLNLPTTIKTISGSAFYGCSSIDAIVVRSYASIGTYAFYNCTGAKEISLVGGSVSEDAFFGCSGIKELVIPSGLSMVVGSFAGLSQLEELTMKRISAVDSKGNATRYVGSLFGEDSYDGSYYASGYEIPETLKKITLTNADVLYDGAFVSCRTLTEVRIEALSKVGINIFNGCTSLETLYLPHLGNDFNNDEKITFVKTVGERTSIKHVTIGTGYRVPIYGFHGYDSLETISLPDTVRYIEKMAFYGCEGLTEIKIPSSLLEIGEDAFDFTNISKIYITNLQGWCQVTVPAYDDAPLHGGATLYLNDKEIEGALEIPSGTTSIAIGAFYGCDKITSVYVPSSVEIIGSIAFQDCTALNTLTLNHGIDEISSSAFRNTSLRELKIPNSLLKIGAMAFSRCQELIKVSFGSSISTVGALAFDGCYRLTEVYRPRKYSVEGVTGYNDDCISLYASIIHESTSEPSVLTEDENGFIFALLDGKYYLVTKFGLKGDVALPDTINGSTYDIRRYAFYGREITSINIPDGTEVIGNCAFYHSHLKAINLNKVKTVEESAFGGSKIESLIIPNGVLTLRGGAFGGCTRLTNVSWTETEGQAIGKNLFENCRALEKIVIPSNITVISDGMFFDCESLSDVTLSDKTTELGRGAFRYCAQLMQISLPNTLKYIDIECFKDSGLTSIHLPVGIIDISNNCFENCKSLKTVTYDSLYMDVNTQGFKNATSLSTFDLNRVRGVGMEGFYNCYCLHITLSSTLTGIGDRAYHGCYYSGTKLTIPKSVSMIGTEAFSTWVQLEEIVFGVPDVRLILSEQAFKGLYNLKSMTLPTSTEMAEGIFDGCYSLESITVPYIGLNKDGTKTSHQSETTLGYLFSQEAYENSYEVKVVYEKTATTHDIMYFYIPLSLKKVTITAQEAIGDYAFDGITSLNTIVLPETTKAIGKYAFAYTTITGITLPNGINSIEEYAFTHCESLRSITIPSSTTAIMENVFYGCTALGSVIFVNQANWSANVNGTIHYNVDVSSGSQMAKYFVEYYHDSSWHRIEENN